MSDAILVKDMPAKARSATAKAGRVPPPRRKATSDLATTVLASIAIALPLMFYLRQHVEILRYGYEIEALKDRRADLVERSRELAVDRAAAASLPEIHRRAAALGLAAPAAADVFVATGSDLAGSPEAECLDQERGIAVTASLE